MRTTLADIYNYGLAHGYQTMESLNSKRKPAMVVFPLMQAIEISHATPAGAVTAILDLFNGCYSQEYYEHFAQGIRKGFSCATELGVIPPALLERFLSEARSRPRLSNAVA